MESGCGEQLLGVGVVRLNRIECVCVLEGKCGFAENEWVWQGCLRAGAGVMSLWRIEVW